MKNRLCTCLRLFSFVMLFVFVACNKSNRSGNNDTETNNTLVPTDGSTLLTTPNQCPNGPNYGDSVVYLQPVNGQYMVSPVNNSGISGTYLSWPEGLSLN